MVISGIKNKAGQKGPPASMEGQGHPWLQEVLVMQGFLWSRVQNTGVSLKEGKQATVDTSASQPSLAIVLSSSTPSFQEENRFLILQAMAENISW